MPPRLIPSRYIRQTHLPSLRRSFHPDRTIQEYDVLLLKQSLPRAAKWRFTPPLRNEPSAAPPIKLTYGATVAHKDLIGRKLLDVVKDTRGQDVTLYEGSLASHVQAMDRCATPIYPHDAQTIVNMMDLHFDPADDTSEPFEVFEAGTGAGSLTIHIARALHAANPPLPLELREALPKHGMSVRKAVAQDSESGTATDDPSKEEKEDVSTGQGGNISHITFHNEDLTSQAKEYVSKRRAILHTLDHKPQHTRTAHGLIRKFRRGLYLPHIDFHNGSISSYLAPRLASRSGRPFLSRAALDLPAPQREAAHLVPCLHPNATLVVFAPSISQIGDFIKWSTTTGQDLRLDRVAELVTSSSAEFGVGENEGGRAWRVKTVVPKVYRADKTGRQHVEGEEGGDGAHADGEQGVVQIMRPKVGERICGGGFVAVLRKVRVGQGGEGPEVVEVEEVEEEARGEDEAVVEEESARSEEK